MIITSFFIFSWSCYQICQRTRKKIKPWRIEGDCRVTQNYGKWRHKIVHWLVLRSVLLRKSFLLKISEPLKRTVVLKKDHKVYLIKVNKADVVFCNKLIRDILTCQSNLGLWLIFSHFFENLTIALKKKVSSFSSSDFGSPALLTSILRLSIPVKPL